MPKTAKQQSQFNRILTEPLTVVAMHWIPSTSVVSGGVEAAIEEMAPLPKFLVTDDAFGTLNDMKPGVVTETVQNLVQADLCHLPFKDLVIERTIPAVDKTNRLAFLRFTEHNLTEEPDELPPQYREDDHLDYAFTASFAIECSKARGGFQMYPIKLVVVPRQNGEEIFLASRDQDWWTAGSDDHGFHQSIRDGEKAEDIKNMVVRTLIHFIVLYGTRGITRTKIEPKIATPSRLSRLIKSRAGKQEVPRFTHTVVDLDPAIKHLAGKTYRDGSGRASPRLHWRMGHTRNAPCGPGHKERKPVWIPGCMVGYDALGRVTHDYRV